MPFVASRQRIAEQLHRAADDARLIAARRNRQGDSVSSFDNAIDPVAALAADFPADHAEQSAGSGVTPPVPEVPGVARDAVLDEVVAYVQLLALPISPRWARRHAQAVLSGWLVPPATIETAVLVVSELVTNSVAALTLRAEEDHAVSGLITQVLRCQPGRIVIEVSDSDPDPPVLNEASPEAESGRGLLLVQALSKEWSFCFSPSGGKTIFAVISAPEWLSSTRRSKTTRRSH